MKLYLDYIIHCLNVVLIKQKDRITLQKLMNKWNTSKMKEYAG